MLASSAFFLKAEAKTPTEKALLWEILGNGLTQPSYLFGTIHMACTNQLALTPEQKKAIGKVQQLYIELGSINEEIRTKKSSAKSAEPQKLKDVMTAAQYQIVEDFFEKSYLDFVSENVSARTLILKLIDESIKRVDVYYYKNLCRETTSKERILLEFAKKHGISTGDIETLADRTNIYQSIPLQDLVGNLIDTINSMKTAEKFDNGISPTYFAQDIDTLIKESRNNVASLDKAYLIDRNLLWLGRMPAIMRRKSAFFAFGASHLGGKDGLIDLLKKKGYRLRPIFDTPVKYPLAAHSSSGLMTARKYFEAGNKMKELGETLAAIDNYSQAIAIDSQFIEAYYSRASLREDKLGDFTGALADFNQAIAIKPSYIDVYRGRAMLKVNKLEDFSGALSDLNQAIKLQGQEVVSNDFLDRGLVQDKKLNNFQAALADYNLYLSLVPQSIDGYLARGLLKYNKLKDRFGGISDLKRAAKLAYIGEQKVTLDKIRAILEALGIEGDINLRG